MRAFIGVWPTVPVVEAVQAIHRPVVPGLRWTTPDQWHVTLRFCGRLPEADLPDLLTALETTLTAQRPVTAPLGPATERLGRRILHVPVTGLEDLVEKVDDAAGGFGDALGDRGKPFRGHLTLARSKRAIPADLVGVPVAVRWEVGAVVVASSTTAPAGARYRTEARVPLARR